MNRENTLHYITRASLIYIALYLPIEMPLNRIL